MKALAGIVLVAAHVVAFVRYVPSCRRPELVVVVAEDAAGHVRSSLVTISQVRTESLGVRGLGYTRHVVRYRGGFERAVGHATYASRHEAGAPACTGRVIVGQRLLDDGHASPGTIAGEMARAIAAELAGEGFVGIGDFEAVEAVSLRWTELAKHPEDLPLVGGAQAYVRAKLVLVFSRLRIPLDLALIPKPSARQLDFEVVAVAQVEVDNRVLQWLSDKLGGANLATRFARREIDAGLVTTLAPPPPFTLPGGQQLAFVYCDGPAVIADGAYGALPFGIATGTAPHASALRPPARHGPAPRAPVPADTAVAIELDLDGANELLFELWRTGFLDRRLAGAGLDRRFNADPIVTEYLTLRITPPRLARPPVIGGRPGGLTMLADARVTITDGDAATVGRVWGGLDFTFAGAPGEVAVELGALELSCERAPARAELAAARRAPPPGARVTALVPCYADLVGALRDRGSEFHGELTRVFATLLDDLFVDQRVGASGVPAELVIRGARASYHGTGDNGALRVTLDAAVTGG